MDIMELGAIGEFVSGIAVVVSLVYVGLQVRYNTAAIRASSAQAFADSINGVNFVAAGDQPRVARLVFEEPDSMSEDERVSAEFMTLATCRSFESALLQAELGAFDAQTIDMVRLSLRRLFATDFYREWWDRQQFPFTDRFVRFVEDQCLTAQAPGSARKSGQLEV